MAVEVVMPKLGWSMEVGSLVEWLKADGQMVQPGEILFTVESDKAVTEVEALEGGTLRIPPSSPLPGEPVPVGTVLAYLVQPDELAGIEVASPSRRMVAADEPAMGQGPELEGAATGRTGEEPRRPAISPRARRLAAELSVNWAGLQGSGRTGRIVERDIRGAAVGERPAGEIRISPLARRLGEEAGVDLAALARRLPGKRITRQDVEEAIQQRASSHPRPGAAGTAEGGPDRAPGPRSVSRCPRHGGRFATAWSRRPAPQCR